MFLLPVQGVTELAPEIFEVALERRGYRFVPGECAVLFDGGAESRPYSIASAPDDEVLRFLIRRMPDGVVSRWLTARAPGDGVRISTPFGDFRPGREGPSGAPIVFVATGVGIAPFLSWARGHEAISCPSPRPSPRGGEGVAVPVCLYGVRRMEDAVALDVLRRRTALRLAVSREAAARAHHGRVTDLLADLPITADTQFFLCGIDAMVDEVAYWLDAHGVDHARVHTEVFFRT